MSWLTLEIGHTLFLVFDLPHGGLQFVFVLLAVGFPFALLGAWQGWFGAAARAHAHAHAHAESPAAPDKHEGHPHEGPWLAVIFGTVALFAVAVAIGVRFYGMGGGHGGSSHGSHGAAHASPPQSAESANLQESAHPVAAAFAPPAHSIAVLPFVNMSGDPQQEYFSDGLSEELLNALARVKQLQVAARTSSFSFKGERQDIEEIARKLNVGAVLEGSVRKAGNRVRITAQLVNAVTGFHLWSQTYDRDLEDVFAIQTEIATTVTGALQATLLENTPAMADVGGTQNPAALDEYLQGVKLANATITEENLRVEIAAYTKAIDLDSRYAKAYAARSVALSNLSRFLDDEARVRETFDRSRADTETALKLAPDLGAARRALAAILYLGFFDYAAAEAEYSRALALAPGDAGVLRSAASFFSVRGRAAEAIPLAEHAVRLDPLNARSVRMLGLVLLDARRFDESISMLNRALSLDPGLLQVTSTSLGLAHMWLGDNEAARTACEKSQEDWPSKICLAVVYHRLGRKPQAEAMLRALTDTMGDSGAYQYAQIHAQWGNTSKALEWLETAYRLHDPGLFEMKPDALLDPLRHEPRFQEIEREVLAGHLRR